VDRRRIVFVIFDGFQSLDLTGPHEVFQHADQLAGGYRRQIVAPRPGPVASSSGLPVHAARGVADLDPGGVDTLVATTRVSTPWWWRAAPGPTGRATTRR
jgi:transcriptional regulator GlxA family with amidase domain